MAKADTKHLTKFLKPFTPEVRALALKIRGFIWDNYPKANELIYDNYNAVAVGWSPTDRVGHIFVSMAIGRSNGGIHFGFYWGSELSDPKKILLGEGNQYRFIRVAKYDDLPVPYLKKLMKEAYANSLAKVKDKSQLMSEQTIMKSISAKKRSAARKAKKPKRKL